MYNGIDQSMFKPNLKDKYKLRKKYNLKDNDIVFLFSGRVCEEKGVLPLVVAFKRICEKYDNCKLLIVGSSFYSSTMNTKFIRNIKSICKDIQDKIVFTGFIPYNKMPEIYQLSDILVVPSLFEEALSLTLLEGMSTQLPVLITKSGGMPEVVVKENAFIAIRENVEKDLEKYMIKLIENKKLRDKMGIESLQRSKTFSMEKFINSFWEKVDGILK